MAKKNLFLKEHMESNKEFFSDKGESFTLENAIEQTLLNALQDKTPFVDLKARLSEHDYNGKNVFSEGQYAVVFYAKDDKGHRTDFFQELVDCDPKKGIKTSLVTDAYHDLFSAVCDVHSSHVYTLEENGGEHLIFKDKIDGVEFVSQNPHTSLVSIDYRAEKMRVAGVGQIPEYVRVILHKPK